MRKLTKLITASLFILPLNFFIFFVFNTAQAQVQQTLPNCPQFSTNPDIKTWKSNSRAQVNEMTIGVDGLATIVDGTTLYAYHSRPSNNSYITPNDTSYLSSIDRYVEWNWYGPTIVYGSPSSKNSTTFKPYDQFGDLLLEGQHTIILSTSKRSDRIKDQKCKITYTLVPNSQLLCGISVIPSDKIEKSYQPGDTIDVAGTFYYTDETRYKNQKIDIRLFSNTKTPLSGSNGKLQDDQNTNSLGDFKGSRTVPNVLYDNQLNTYFYITASPNGKNIFDEQTCSKPIYISRTRGQTPTVTPPATSLASDIDRDCVPGDASSCKQGSVCQPIANKWRCLNDPLQNSVYSNQSNPCSTGSCATAIGSISTDVTAFITNVFRILLGFSGGIALILIISSGYKFMTSQGNPEQVQAAKETLTSAIVGLLFIIFSFVILQVIGADILKIPGFGG